MLKRSFLYTIVFIVFVTSCNKLSNQNDISGKINEIAKLQDLAKNAVNDSTLLYLAKAQRIINGDKKIPDSLVIENIFRKGHYYKKIGVKDSAAIYLHKTIDLVKKPNNRKRNLTYFWITWAFNEDNNNLANAISVAEKFIEISDVNQNIDDILFAYNYLERVNLSLGNYDKALYYNTKTLEAAKIASNLDMYVITGNSKALMLYNLHKKEQAFKLLDSLSQIDVGKDAKRQLNRTYGILNYFQGDYKKAIERYKATLKLSKDITNNVNYNLIEAYTNIAEAYIENKDYKLAETYLDSTQIIIKPTSFQTFVNFYNELRFRLNHRMNKNEDELLSQYLKLNVDIKKQHENKINEKLVALDLANEKEKIAIAEKNASEIRNIKLVALLCFSGLLMLLGYLFYRQRRYKFEKQDMQMQQRLLRSQMNPHFTFNTISAIQDQIGENQHGAANYLLKFSRLLRLILENSLSNYVQIENELESLRKYMDLQLLRFPNQFKYHIVLENFEEDELLFIPPMLLQPFIENSIEHGFSGIHYKGQIDIKLELQGKFIACSIEDNGVGLKASKDSDEISVSTKLISTFLKKATKQNVVISTKHHPNSGVIVKFLIPYKFSKHD